MSVTAAPEGRYLELAGQRAFITGGSQGIGFAIAKALAAEGVQVALTSRNLERAKVAAEKLGASHCAISADVRERGSLQSAFDQAVSRLGGIEICIANAGVSSIRRATEISDEEWQDAMDVNARGVFLTNQIAARHFLERKSGVIVNTASFAAKTGLPLLAHYSASKFAVIGWTQALARELAPDGIRVNAICPGFVRTPMQEREIVWEAEIRNILPEKVLQEYVSLTPMGRIETPQDVADVVSFLCSEGARFMTGQAINVTGGVWMS